MLQVYQAALPFLAAYGGLALALGCLNLLFARRSQVDTWCNANPYAAAAFKALRGAGTDPWLLLQSASLLVRGKLPDRIESAVDLVIPPPPRMPLIALMLATTLALGQTSCASTQTVLRTAEKCDKSSEMLQLDATYSYDLARICPGVRGADLERDCPEYEQLRLEYAKKYDEVGLRCSDGATVGGA